MFHWDRGLFLNRPRMGLDVQRAQPHGFISHAHGDHMARHGRAYCTPETAALYRTRLGLHRHVVELSYGRPYRWGPWQLTTWPAGHCLGSAMLHVENAEPGATSAEFGSLLYTGDFKLGPSATAATAQLPQADVLIMECTFGRPQYRLPPRAEVVAQLTELVAQVLEEGATPVVHAYALGKAQEVTRLLTLAGIGVLQHPAIWPISETYRQLGVDLGDVQCYVPERLPGKAVVTLPKQSRNYRLPGIERPVSIAATGWGVDSRTRYRWQVEHVIPLSDHADFDELCEAVRLVDPRQVYCMHGPMTFVDQLRDLGWEAFPVAGPHQLRLF